MYPTARLGLALLALFSFAATLASAATGVIRNAPVPITDTSLPEVYDLDAPPTLDLDNYFTFPSATSGDFGKITTPFGDIYIEFLAADAPLSVANFKSYLATDSTSATDLIKTYDDVFVHRVVKGFVLQTGGYKIAAPLALLTVTKKAAVANEFKVANTRGTLAMAKLDNQPNSATDEWFINLADNRANLDNQNGGFTAFARVLGDGMAIADKIAALKIYDVDANNGSTFDTVPLRYGGGDLNKSHFIDFTKVRAVSSVPAGADTLKLAYSIIANSNPKVATATVDANGVLQTRKGTMTGHTYMTLRVQAVGGHYLDVPFTVVRAGVPVVVAQLPKTTTAALGATLTLPARVSAWPLNIQWQLRASPTANWTDIADDDARFSGATSETLTLNLAGANPAAVAAALALNNQQIRFHLTNNHGGTPRVTDGTPTTLLVTATLGFQTTPTVTVTDPLAVSTKNTTGTVVSGKPGATLTAPLGGTIVLRRPALPATYPAPTYRWERLAPGTTTWEPLIDAASVVIGTGNAANPQTPAVPSPYSGATTANLTIRLTGPETPLANTTDITTAQTLALHLSQYRCVIRHDRGAGTVPFASPVTTLRITSLPVGVATQPAKMVYGRLSYAPDTTPTTTISVAAKPAAANTPVKYQWQSRVPTPGSPWMDLVEHVAPSEGSSGAPTSYQNVTTSTLTIRFPSDKNLLDGFGLILDGREYRCVLSNILKTASAPFGPAAGQAFSTASTLRVLADTVSLVTQESFLFPGLRSPADGVTFTASGLPAGLSMDKTSSLVTGVPTAKPGVYKVTVTTKHGSVTTVITYYLELLPLIYNSLGSYEVLLSPADQPPLAKLTLTITATGTLTGTLATADEKALLALKGAVVRDVATGVLSLKAPIVISRPAVPARPADPALEVPAEPAIPAGRAYVLTDLAIPPSGAVSVKLNTRQTASASLVELAAATSVLIDDADEDTNNKIEVGDPGLRLSTYTKTNAAPWANINRYTLAFSDPVPLAATEARIPSGSGYATATMAADGKLSLRGKLGDGTVLTATLSSDLGGDYRLFVRPYDRPGAYFSAFINTTGIASVTPDSGNSDFTRYTVAHSLGNTDPDDDFDDGAQVFWRRPAGAAKPAAYSAGFPPLGLRVRMEPWYYTAFEQLGFRIASDGNSATIDLVLGGAGMDNAAPNPRALPTRLRLTKEPVPKKTNTYAFVLAAATLPDSAKLTGTLDTTTGFFSGQLILTDPPAVSRTVPYEGVFLVAPEPFQVDWEAYRFLDVPVGKITAEGVGFVPALSGGAPATSRVTLDKSAAE